MYYRAIRPSNYWAAEEMNVVHDVWCTTLVMASCTMR